jgi:alpha-N-arabinofuranosidase
MLQPETHMNSVLICSDSGKARISKHIYGHFAESPGTAVYPGIWVGPDSSIPNTRGIRKDVVEALQNVKAANLRWPGGAYAERYRWRDGIGPLSSRKPHEEFNDETNEFGTHEFLDFCDMVGCEPYLCCSTTSGTVEEARDWLRYLTADDDSGPAKLRRKNGRREPWNARLWAVGNEVWAYCDKPAPYAGKFLEYEEAMRAATDQDLYLVACGPGGTRYDWTDTLMRIVGTRMEGLAFHHYTLAGPWADKGPALGFTEQHWALSMQNSFGIETMVYKHSEIMDRYDPGKKVALVMDEWGVWHSGASHMPEDCPHSPGTIRDAIVAAMMLNMFNNHCERLRVANIAMLVNALHPLYITHEDRLLRTPTSHVYEMFTVHHEATMLPLITTADRGLPYDYTMPGFNASASRDDAGRIHLTLCNVTVDSDREISCRLASGNINSARGRILTSDAIDGHNTFREPDRVAPAPFEGASIDNGIVKIALPARSVVLLELA